MYCPCCQEHRMSLASKGPGYIHFSCFVDCDFLVFVCTLSNFNTFIACHRIEEELGENAVFAGANFRNPN